MNAGDAQNHVRHTLMGRTMSSEVSAMDVVNQAGRFICAMHPWNWLKKRAALLNLESGLGFVRLPRDIGSLLAVRGATSSANGITLMGLDGVHALRLDGVSAYPWAGAVARRTLPAQNLLKYSEALNQTAAWEYSEGTGTVTGNAAVNPYTGAQTVTTVSDDDAATTSALTQTIGTELLRDATTYTAWLAIRPEPLETTTPPKTALWVHTESPLSGGLQTLLEIQWGQTPWQDPPTVTVISTNTGLATALTATPAGDGFWLVGLSGYTHELDRNYGRLLFSIQPSRAAWADASGSEDVAQVGTVSVARCGVNEGLVPFDYEETGPTIDVPRRLEPVLEISPVPSATSVGALSVLYRAFWADAEDDDDDLALPSEGWLDTLYIQCVRAFARGWEEEGQGSLDARLAEVYRGPIYLAARQHDGRMQPSRGQSKNTAMDMASWGDSGRWPRFPVSMTSVTPTTP